MSRQIRNAVQTAVAMARFESPSEQIAKLKVKHIATVAKTSDQFYAYMTETLRGTNSDIAEREGLRSDHFSDHPDKDRNNDDDDDVLFAKKNLKADDVYLQSYKKQRRALQKLKDLEKSNRTALAILSADDDSSTTSESDIPKRTTKTKEGKQDLNF